MDFNKLPQRHCYVVGPEGGLLHPKPKPKSKPKAKKQVKKLKGLNIVATRYELLQLEDAIWQHKGKWLKTFTTAVAKRVEKLRIAGYADTHSSTGPRESCRIKTLREFWEIQGWRPGKTGKTVWIKTKANPYNTW